MNYRESIDWLFSTQMFGIKLGLDGPRRLLREYLAFPAHETKVIHVAGTNGKGSTCAMIDSLARAAGRRSGLFTSPHLIDFRERIQVGGVMISEQACAERLTELRAICEASDPHPTFFEITLVLAMRWFRECGCDLIVLETGMGGRLDATTAVPADVSAITPIGMDHAQWLGDTLEEIAAEKAGIFVRGKPAFSSPQPVGARRVLSEHANECQCSMAFIEEPLRGYPLGLIGEHQAWNAALAVECLYAAGQPLDYGILQHGLSKISWPGRFECFDLESGPLVLDGAHNPAAAKVLAETWRQVFGEQKACLIFSAVEGKDLGGIEAEIGAIADEVHLVRIESARALDLEVLRKIFADYPHVHLHVDLPKACAAAFASTRPVLVTGSIFLIGAVKALLSDESWQSSLQ